MRILVTGSRAWTDRTAVTKALFDEGVKVSPLGTKWSDITLVHGAARGLDTIAAEIASDLGMQVEAYPADWETFGRAAGHRRNAVMVASGADICLAFPLGESRGTRGCMRLAEKAGIPVVNVGDEEEVSSSASM